MKHQRGIWVVIIILTMVLQCGCGEKVKEKSDISFKDTMESQMAGKSGAAQDISADQANGISLAESRTEQGNRYNIGDTVTYQVGDFGEIKVTLTEWGSKYDEIEGILLYADYTIENTGTEKVSVGGDMFEVYADDYHVEQDYLQDDTILIVDLPSGRKVNGTFYAYVNPDNAETIEVECYDSIFILKDGNSDVPETMPNSGDLEGADVWQISFRWEEGSNEDAKGAELILRIDETNDAASIEGNGWSGMNVGEFSGQATQVYDDGTIEFMDENGYVLFVSPLEDGGIYVEESGQVGGIGTTFAGTYQQIP